MTIGVFFGSTTGNTEDVAENIQKQLQPLDVTLHNIADDPLSLMPNYQLLICGIPTWDYGELQADWEDIWHELDTLHLEGRYFAVFGCGDQIGYPEWFQDAIGLLHDKLHARGAKPLGYWPTAGYAFEQSKAAIENNDRFVGLAIDEDNQHELTQQRIQQWCQQLINEYNANH